MRLGVTEAPDGRWAILVFGGAFDATNVAAVARRVDELPASCRLIVMDWRGLTFCNSAALGYLIRMRKAIVARGGDAVVVGPTRFMRKTIRTLGLGGCFHIFESAAEVVRETATSDWLAATCPGAGCGAAIRWILEAREGMALSCSRCGAELTLGPEHAPGVWRVRAVRWPTRDGEGVSLKLRRAGTEALDGRTAVAVVVGQLDLFAADAVELARDTLPPPRRVCWDLRGVTHHSSDGVRALRPPAPAGHDVVAIVAPADGRLREALLNERIPVVAGDVELGGGLDDPADAPSPLLVEIRPCAPL